MKSKKINKVAGFQKKQTNLDLTSLKEKASTLTKGRIGWEYEFAKPRLAT